MNEVFPLLHVADVDQVTDWAIASLGLRENWRASSDSGVTEHAELLWYGGRISINITREGIPATGPSGIALRADDHAKVDRAYQLAQQSGAKILQTLAESPVAYSFTAEDPVGNQWWVNCETGFLDQIRKEP